MSKKRIALLFGTRPDTIKMAPVILELRNYPDQFEAVTIATAQHRNMLDQVLDVFGIEPDHDLDIMAPRQTLTGMATRILSGLDELFGRIRPDMVLVQGDTSTTAIGSLAAFYQQIPVGHIEAGLRTGDKANPFPEEINRRITGCISDLHFAPTASAREALLRENTDPKTVFVTGNTVIDALKIAVDRPWMPHVASISNALSDGRKVLLVTIHRRENWGAPMAGACRAVRRLALDYPDLSVLFPVHLNPAVREVIYPILGDVPNIRLTEPLDYPDFVQVMSRSHLILTDSGGVQEEGPFFGIPILVLRKVTERPDAVESGTVRLVGLDEEEVYRATADLLDNPTEYRAMATAVNPYGDGLAARRIIGILRNHFRFSNKRVEEFVPGK